MWGRNVQLLIWLISYMPVFLISIYRHFFEKSMKTITILKFEASVNLIHVTAIVFIVVFSIFLYRVFPELLFRKIKKEMFLGRKGQSCIVKKSTRPSINDYTFFLLTLILPLITVDFSSIVSMLVCLFVVIFIIVLLTKIDYIIACPLFFLSKYKVWKVTITEGENESREVFAITLEEDFFEKNYKTVKLIKNVVFLAKG